MIAGRAIGTAVAALALAACTPATQRAPASPPQAASAPTDTGGLVPPGYGTLRQEDVAVQLQVEGVQVRMIPLDEGIIRLLAADSYRALHELARGRQAEVERAAAMHQLRQRNVWLVSFFGLAPEARFVAADVTITSGAREFRPLEIVPLTSGFGAQRVRAREVQSALYVFDDGLALSQPLVVTTGAARSSDWSDVMRRVERERALARSRAAAARGS